MKTSAIEKLEQGIFSALETYSNVHRGSGHGSMVSTHLYECARNVVLEHFGLTKNSHEAIFCSPDRSSNIVNQLSESSYKSISSEDLGLSLGVVSIAIRRDVLNSLTDLEAGGGTARLLGRGWVVWANKPDVFEAGTPAVINVLAFSKALQIAATDGLDVFKNFDDQNIDIDSLIDRDEFGDLSGEDLLYALSKTIIGKDLMVPTARGDLPYVNLDNSASTRTLFPVWNAFRRALRLSKQKREKIKIKTEKICLSFLGADEDQFDIALTSNTTEAINLAARNVLLNTPPEEDSVIVTTIMEHSSNDLPWRVATFNPLVKVGVDENGFIDCDHLEKLFREYNQQKKHGNKRIKLMSITGASNVLGSCNDIGKISNICHKYGASLFVDAAQLVAHKKIDMQESGIDILAFSAHKIYAPFGVGALVYKKNLVPVDREILPGIGMTNSAGVAALGKSLTLMSKIGLDEIDRHERGLAAIALEKLSQIKGLTIHGIADPNSELLDKKVGVIVFSHKGKWPDQIANTLAREGGVGIRFGCHCAHLAVKNMLDVNPVFEQFQRFLVTFVPQVGLPGVSRVSFGIENTIEDVERLAETLLSMTDKKRPSGKKELIKTTKGKIASFIRERESLVFG